MDEHISHGSNNTLEKDVGRGPKCVLYLAGVGDKTGQNSRPVDPAIWNNDDTILCDTRQGQATKREPGRMCKRERAQEPSRMSGTMGRTEWDVREVLELMA